MGFAGWLVPVLNLLGMGAGTAAAPTPPVADFSGTPLSGAAPLAVIFTDLSTNTPVSWHWEKNDGSGWVDFAGSPTAENPSESFVSGTWSVRLTATNAGGSDTKTRTNYVTATTPPPAGAPRRVFVLPICRRRVF